MRIIKMFVKVAVISVGVVMFMILVLLIFALSAQRGEGTGETKGMSISYEITGKLPDFSKSDKEIPDERYYDTVEEAMKNGVWPEGAYQQRIDTVIKKLESDDYVSIFYLTKKDKKTECFTACKLKAKVIDGRKKYAPLFAYPIESKKNGRYGGDSTSMVRTALDFSDYEDNMSVDGEDKRFIWGNQRFKNVFTLKVEGQEPTEIIPYEIFGKVRYFWYYEDLKSDKPGQALEFEMEVLKDYKKDL